MKFRINNIGKIISADINLDGLTVIAGSNNSGKSTVGRTLYSLVAAYKNAAGYTREKRRSLFLHIAELFYSRFSAFISAISLPDSLAELMYLFEFSDAELIDKLNISIEEVQRMDETPRRRSLILAQLRRMMRIVNRKDPQQIIVDEINSALYSEFYGRYQRIGTTSSFIETEDLTGRMTVSLSDKSVVELKSDQDFSIFSDATYVESPLYLHVLSDLYYKSTLGQPDFRISDVPSHVIDFVSKIQRFRYNESSSSEDNEAVLSVLDEICEIVAGRFERSEEQDILTWKDKYGNEFIPINIASGIKSFGILQMLIQSGQIQTDKLLVWDEPENHLHPEWQIKMAELLVKLCKAGVPVLVSSHSPYFIQAIRYASSKHEMEKYVNFYLAEEQKKANGVIIDDVTDDLNRLFIRLAEPLDSIMNL